MSSLLDSVLIQIKSELQYDVDAEHPPFPSGSLSAITMTASETTNMLNVYYINKSSIFSAYQDVKRATAGAPIWRIEDTQFPSNIVPKLIRAITRPSSSDILLASTNNNKIYLLDLSARFPKWKKLFDPPNIPITDVQVFISSTDKLLIAIQSGTVIYIGQHDKLVDDGWVLDLATQAAFAEAGGISRFKVSPDLGDGSNGTSYGYLVACNKGGLYTLTGGPYATAGDVGHARIQFALRTLDKTGIYTSVWAASIPDGGSSLPVVFAGDNKFGAYYFQPQMDGNFVKTRIFTDTNVQALEPIIRTEPIFGTGNVILHVEIFGLGPKGGVYHLQSAYDSDTSINGFTLLANGNYSVQAWQTTASQISDNAAAICSQNRPSADGSAFILQYSNLGTPSLVFLRQDPETSDWSTQAVALPGGGSSGVPPDIHQFPVYYVEATVYDGDMVPTSDCTVVITASQDATINVNGKTVQVSGTRSYTTLSNAAGRISFSQVVNDSLYVPTFTLWAGGMSSSHVMDVKPNGQIQELISGLTVSQLRSAKNMDSPNHYPLFPPDKVDDHALQEATNGFKGIFSVFHPQPPATSQIKEETDTHQVHPFQYIHPGTRSSLARTRHSNGRSMGRVIGRAEYGVMIELHPHLKVTRFPRGQPPLEDANLFGLKISWGDLWHGIKKGVYKINTYLLNPIVNAVKATINVFKEGVQYVWNGAVNHTQKAFDFVGGIFEKIGAAFKEVFGWLAFLFDWDAIKNTAHEFQTALRQFPVFGKQLFADILPGITKGGFVHAKAWLNENMGTVQSLLGDTKIGEFDDASKIPRAGAVVDGRLSSGRSVLDDLPSSANWLLNKLFNAGSGSAGDIMFSSSTSAFDRLSSTFMQNIEDIGAKQDFYNAIEDFGKMLMTFKDKGAMDGTSWASLLLVVKDLLFLLLDIAEMAVLTMESVLAEAMAFVMDILNEPLNIPIVSWVFEKVCGVKLTIINSVSFIIAIPFRILYKLITGNKPPTSFALGPHETSAESPTKSLNIAKGTIMILQSLWTPIFDAGTTTYDVLGGFGVMLRRSTFIGRISNGLNICLPLIIFGLGGYPALERPNTFDVLGWTASLLPPGAVIYTMIKDRNAMTPSPSSMLGATASTLVGVGQLGYAIALAVRKKSDNPPNALVISKFFVPWSSLSQCLHIIAVKAPATAPVLIPVKLVVEFVSMFGAAVAFISAYSISDEEGKGGEKENHVNCEHHGQHNLFPLISMTD